LPLLHFSVEILEHEVGAGRRGGGREGGRARFWRRWPAAVEKEEEVEEEGEGREGRREGGVGKARRKA
jgi:hypothetical protein